MGIERQTLKFNWKKQCKNGQDTSGGKDGRSAGRPYSYGSLLTETAQDLFAANNSGVCVLLVLGTHGKVDHADIFI